MNNRRSFLKKFGLSSAALLVAGKIYADPYQPLKLQPEPRNIVKISGQVLHSGKGIKGVVVSDGLSTVVTDENGLYTILSDAARQFVFISLPSGYKIPQNGTGTAKFYSEISGDNEQIINFSLLKEEVNDTAHSFLVLADPQTQNMEEINNLHSQTVPDIQDLTSNITTPVFGIACGDIMFDNLELFPQYEQAVKQTRLPFFQVFGNHDAEVLAKTDELSIKTFQKHFGPGYYSFNKGEIHYVVLDDVFWFGDYIGYISQQQLDWLKNDLEFIESGKTVVVFAHIPVFSYYPERLNDGSANSNIVTNRELLYKILEPFNSYLICGHTHESEFIKDGKNEIHVGGAVCGAWWSGPICWDGTPNGYSVYSVKGSELKWQYKSTGMALSHQMRLYKKDNSILANVWNADSQWRISAYFNGNKIPMKQYTGTDPLSMELHAGESNPKKHSWVEPIPTNHLFISEIQGSKEEITVEAIDRWGRIYTEKIII